MFVEIFDIESLKIFFDLVYNTTTNIELKFDKDKLTISLLNNSHVCFYNCEYYKDFFGEYVVDDIEVILLDVSDFYNILKSATKDDVLTLETKGMYLICKFEHEGNRRVFELSLLDDWSDNAVPPQIDYDGAFNVSLRDLKQPCIDLDKIVKTDKFKMITSNNTLNVVAPVDSMIKYSQEIDIEYNDNVTSTVNLQYISDLQKLSKINKEVVFRIGDNLPVSWEITSPDNLIKISGLIAMIMEVEE